jgi:hypothetical protein
VGIPTELGPVEYLVIGFENGKFDGSALAELGTLQERGIIRVLDMMFVSRNDDGSIVWMDYDDADGMDAGVIGSDLVSLLSEDDANELAVDLEPGQAIGVLVFEDTWALKLQERLGAAGGRLLEASRVPKDAVDAALAYAAQESEEVG